MKDEILGIIPARGGSKGIPRKNVRLLAGRPLIHYTIDSAQKSQMLNRVVVSTEDKEIAELASQYGCEILRRPSELALDETPMVPVIQHVVNSLSMNEDYLPEITVVLQPTAPLRRAEHIDDCLRRFLESNANSMVSVCPVPGHYHPDWQFNLTPEGELCMFSGRPLNQIQTHRQNLPTTYSRNGALYAFRTDRFLESGSLYPEPCKAFIMAVEDSTNLDSEKDFRLAEQYLLMRKNDQNERHS